MCDCKHVPKSIQFAQEMKAQRVPASTLLDTKKTLCASDTHEKRILCLLVCHGKAHERLCFWRADNYQRLYNAVASAAAVNASKDTAHIVFTSAIKSGYIVFTMSQHQESKNYNLACRRRDPKACEHNDAANDRQCSANYDHRVDERI